ncbi:hypothetical protein D3C78_1779740 [compost metagenome]
MPELKTAFIWAAAVVMISGTSAKVRNMLGTLPRWARKASKTTWDSGPTSVVSRGRMRGMGTPLIEGGNDFASLPS